MAGFKELSPSASSPYLPLQLMFGDSAYAARPFDHAKADIILRSSDNINFRVFKLFLSLASPFFETLFDVPRPTQTSEDQEIKDGLAVVPVTEHSKTLDPLLRFCYPCTLADDPDLEALGGGEDLSCALESKILTAQPLRCFAIAHRGQLREETLLAAKYTLTQPLIPSWFEEIDMITAADLLALLAYHRECGDAVQALRKNILWIRSHYRTSQGCAWLSGKYAPDMGGRECLCPRSSPPKYRLFENYSLLWWEDFMNEVFLELREKPCGTTVASLAAKTVQNVKDRNCPICSANITEGMRDFSALLVRKVEEVVSQVELDFSVPRKSRVYREDHGPAPGEKGRSKRGKKRR
ncbi:hypothetical protein HD554DRAFT_2280652 [Boletus coccyginus]|nr:hypothetical protein HD554DRAFT_2280652 [Boletus coccyginus]